MYRDRHRGPRLLGAMALALSCLVAPVVGRAQPARIAGRQNAAHYVGWAMDAYPGDSVSTIKGAMARQVQAGANVVWLGHNNPGEVIAGKGEPALSYAVWAAYRAPSDPQHGVAVAMIDAQRNALEAARQLGVQVVFPVGYQIQMGAAWNHAHPQDLRVGADGGPYNHGGQSASFYAPDYRRDIVAYYRWVDATFIQPYTSTILMVNLADEPADGDYSVWADRAFTARYGFGLHQAGGDAARQELIGRFEADYIDDYAAWSAQQWQQIDPGVTVTMSFCGGYGRYQHEGPDLEAAFREPPSNFVVTFDAYPRDGLYNTPLRIGDLTALFALTRTLGHYAARYNRPLWLWSTANSWGLNGASDDPGNIADAVANGIYLAQLVNQGGGSLQGLAVWNYNIRGQGLFNDTHRLTYDPNQMFARVSASFAIIRAIMSAPPAAPDTVILAPNDSDLRAQGATLVMRATDAYDWTALAAPARDNAAAVVLTHLDGETLPGLHGAIVLARSPGDLSLADRGALLTLLGQGGVVIAAPPVARAVIGASDAGRIVASGGSPTLTVRRLATSQGTLLSVDGGQVERLFSDANFSWAAPLWTEVFNRPAQASGYLLSAGGVTLLYGGIAPNGASITLPVGSGAAQGTLTIYDMHGAAQQSMPLSGRAGQIRVFVPRRAYALVPPSTQ